MINVSLVGNPNTGKTTLFNCLTGANERVGNWHGVTVEEKKKTYLYKREQICVVDLPGLYSLSPLSFEEQVARDYLIKNPDNIVLNICDASNLKRNLYLTLSLLEFGAKVVLLVNQIDKKPLSKIDFTKLALLLGVEVVHINAGDKKSMDKVSEAIVRAAKNEKRGNLPYLKEIDFSLVEDVVQAEEKAVYYAVKLLEDDESAKAKFGVFQMFGRCDEIAALRYEYIDKTLGEVEGKHQRVYGKSKLDKLVLNRFLALPIFLALLALAFYLTFFSLGSFLSDCFSFILDKTLFSPLLKFLISVCGSSSWVVGLFENAIIAGVGSIISFLPQVALLFLFLSLLEDSGYLSRVAFLFDDILSKVGLSGKAVYTLLMGFGCSTTAVLTARNMEDKNSKIKTALLTPYMSCSAKFPIYSVLGGAFFGAGNIWVILGLYLLGVVVAVFISYILEKTALKSRAQSFILEFPPYRIMSIKRTAKLLWQNVKLFLTRVGGLIVAMNVIVWVLSNFSITLAYIPNGSGVSVLETLGRVLSPLFIPLGFGNWALVASLIAGLVAKEVVVSTIALFNGVEGLANIQSSIISLSAVAGFANISSLLSFLVFALLYVPCLATVSVLVKEVGKRWTAVSIVVEFVVAYLAAFVVYNLSSACEIFGGGAVVAVLGGVALVAGSFAAVCRRLKRRKNCPYSERCGKNCKKK